MKLKRENFVGWLSLPFTAGILAGLALCGAQAWIRVGSCATLFPVVVLSLVFDKRSYAFRWRTAGQCFLLGVCCSLLHSMMPSLDMEGWLERLAAGYCARLKELIESLDWPPVGSRFFDITNSEGCQSIHSFRLSGGFPTQNQTDSAALLTALLTGDRSSLSRELVQTFRVSGASHILALSGLHLGIICVVISKTLSVLGRSPAARHIRAWTTVGLCWFYCLMTGAGPSLVRALLFVCIVELAGLSARRQVSGVRTLLCALMIQLAIRPESVLQAGFQLSYLATAGIVLAFPVLRDFYRGGSGAGHSFGGGVLKRVWDMAALTLSCQILTAPWCYVLFGSLPGHFLLTNLIAIPLTTLAVSAGLIALILTALGICPPVLVTVCDALLHALLSALHIIARM